MKDQELKHYQDHGFIFPIKLFSEEKARDIKLLYENEYNQINSKALKIESKFKSHLIFKFLNDIIKEETILKYVREVIGNDILCWNSIIFSKPKDSGKYVGWHRDKEYWNLANDNVVTVSIAITESNLKNGCLKIYKGKIEKLEYVIEKDKKNMLARGQNALINENDKNIQNIELKPGEGAIFNQNCIHGSDKNNSNSDRILIAIRYISTDNSTYNNHKTATLVSGVDKYNFYEKEPVPRMSFDKKSLNFHSKLMSKQSRVFADEILSKYKIKWLSFILNFKLVRGFYYSLKNMN